ncbi:GNAT family N-acetyltransferase [Patescibacteria group bacterium]|nr:GNAT family N-acetyltransferase [Patescibacteria group bacterium]
MNYFLQGQKIGLRIVAPDDYVLISKWLNDPDVTYYTFSGQLPMTQEQVAKSLDEQLASTRNVIFVVCDLTDGSAVGFAGLYELHPTSHSAEFRVFLGEPGSRGKGFGTEVAELLMFYGFDRLNLHRVFLGANAENAAGIHAYEKAGFKQEGRQRDVIYRNSRYYDGVYMGMLRDEYYVTLYESHQKRFRHDKL